VVSTTSHVLQSAYGELLNYLCGIFEIAGFKYYAVVFSKSNRSHGSAMVVVCSLNKGIPLIFAVKGFHLFLLAKSKHLNLSIHRAAKEKNKQKEASKKLLKQKVDNKLLNYFDCTIVYFGCTSIFLIYLFLIPHTLGKSTTEDESNSEG